MSDLVVQELEIENSTMTLCVAIQEIENVCDATQGIFTGLIAPGGGLESSNFTDVFLDRSADINSIKNQLHDLRAAFGNIIKPFVEEISQIDQFNYSLRN